MERVLRRFSRALIVAVCVNGLAAARNLEASEAASRSAAPMPTVRLPLALGLGMPGPGAVPRLGSALEPPLEIKTTTIGLPSTVVGQGAAPRRLGQADATAGSAAPAAAAPSDVGLIMASEVQTNAERREATSELDELRAVRTQEPVDQGLLFDGSWRRSGEPSVSKIRSLDELSDTIAQRLRAKGIRAIITDYDGTLMDKTPENKAVPASEGLVSVLRRLKQRGITVVVSTNHFFTGDGNSMTALLGDRLDDSTRADMIFVVQSGSRIYRYGPAGQTPQTPAWTATPFDDRENERLHPIFEAAAAAIGLAPGDYKIFDGDSRMLIEVRNHQDVDGALFEELKRVNQENGLGYLVQHKRKPTMREGQVPYVQFIKSTKGTGTRQATHMLKAGRLVDDESQILILGDDFTNNDLFMARAIPGALAISVGEEFDASQPNVVQAAEPGAATTRALLERLAKMLEDGQAR